MDAKQSELAGLAGRFLVFDGPDGSGKTTVRDRVADRLRTAGLAVTTCKDPGGTAVGDRIRSVLLDHDLSDMTVQCETLLFMASRAQLVNQVVRPALAQGHVVLCDRFVSSTCAYQVAAGDDFATILDLARYAIGDTWPDLTLVMDVPVEMGFARIGNRSTARRAAQLAQPRRPDEPADLDAMERRPSSFHAAVRDNFLALPGRYPTPVQIVDATQPLEQVVDHTMQRLRQLGVRTGS